MNLNELYEIERTVSHKMQVLKEKKEAETKAFIEGVDRGIDLMYSAIREALMKEAEEASTK